METWNLLGVDVRTPARAGVNKGVRVYCHIHVSSQVNG